MSRTSASSIFGCCQPCLTPHVTFQGFAQEREYLEMHLRKLFGWVASEENKKTFRVKSALSPAARLGQTQLRGAAAAGPGGAPRGALRRAGAQKRRPGGGAAGRPLGVIGVFGGRADERNRVRCTGNVGPPRPKCGGSNRCF